MGEWSHFAHGADIGVRGEGTTLEDAFAAAALALTAVVSDPKGVEAREEITVHCSAPDGELLLVQWLNEVIFEMDVRKMLFSKFEVTMNGTELTGRMKGTHVDRLAHNPAVEIKGATMTELKVENKDGRWSGEQSPIHADSENHE